MGALQLCATALSDADHHVQSHCAPSVRLSTRLPAPGRNWILRRYRVDTAPVHFLATRELIVSGLPKQPVELAGNWRAVQADSDRTGPRRVNHVDGIRSGDTATDGSHRD